MTKSKSKDVYFVVEVYEDGEIFNRSDEIYAIKNPRTGKLEYEDVFKIDTSLKADNYKTLDDFMAEMVRISSETFDYFDELIVVAVGVEDDMFKWGWDIKFDGEECVDIQTLDYTTGGLKLKYVNEDGYLDM